MPAALIEVDFSALPTGAIGASLQIGGFTFVTTATADLPKISHARLGVVYRFPESGVMVQLPTLCTSVDLWVLSEAGEILAKALSSLGAVLATQIVTAQQSQKFRLLAKDIASVVLTGGSGEGGLVRIGVAIADCS